MRNGLFVPDFLFDFYNNSGSIGTRSALSNVSRAGLDEQYTVSKIFYVRT